MKQELPIAITLLATGLLLWVTQSASTSEIQPAQSAEVSPAQAPPLVSEKVISTPSLNPVLSSAGNGILNQIATQFRDGPPHQGVLKISSQLFGKQLNINGRFWQHGQSSLKSRIELMPETEVPVKVTHLCDGRFCYRFRQRETDQDLAFFDLGSFESSSDASPGMTNPWISTASVDKLFSSLADCFQFNPKAVQGNPSLVELVGTWQPEVLASLTIHQVERKHIVPKIKYEELPPQFPHVVRVRLRKGPQVPPRWAPISVDYLQLDDANPSELKVVMKVGFEQLQPGVQDLSLYRMENVAGRSVDISDRYKNRLRQILKKNRTAASPAPQGVN